MVIAAAGGGDPLAVVAMIRSHEQLLQLIRDFGGLEGKGAVQRPELLAEIDKTLFDLYDAFERVNVLVNIGTLQGCRACDEALAIIKGEESS